jgi:hypothetical protein
MRIVRDDLWLCVDCLFVAVNGDYTGLDYHYGARAWCRTSTPSQATGSTSSRAARARAAVHASLASAIASPCSDRR